MVRPSSTARTERPLMPRAVPCWLYAALQADSACDTINVVQGVRAAPGSSRLSYPATRPAVRRNYICCREYQTCGRARACTQCPCEDVLCRAIVLHSQRCMSCLTSSTCASTCHCLGGAGCLCCCTGRHPGVVLLPNRPRHVDQQCAHWWQLFHFSATRRHSQSRHNLCLSA